MSKYPVSGGDVPALLDRFAQLQEKVRSRTGSQLPIVTIQEAGLLDRSCAEGERD